MKNLSLFSLILLSACHKQNMPKIFNPENTSWHNIADKKQNIYFTKDVMTFSDPSVGGNIMIGYKMLANDTMLFPINGIKNIITPFGGDRLYYVQIPFMDTSIFVKN